MDFENHHFLYFFEKRKNTKKNRKVKLSLSYNDFHCFQLMGFAHVRFSLFDSPKKSFKKLTCEKNNVSFPPATFTRGSYTENSVIPMDYAKD